MESDFSVSVCPPGHTIDKELDNMVFFYACILVFCHIRQKFSAMIFQSKHNFKCITSTKESGFDLLVQ